MRHIDARGRIEQGAGKMRGRTHARRAILQLVLVCLGIGNELGKRIGWKILARDQHKGLLGREYDGQRIDTSAELAEYILDKAEVAVVPGEAFGSPGYLRLSYALGDDDLVEGVTRLQKLFA